MDQKGLVGRSNRTRRFKAISADVPIYRLSGTGYLDLLEVLATGKSSTCLVRVMNSWAAGSSDGTACTATAGSGAAGATFGLGRAAAWAAALSEQVGELMELHGRGVGLGQLGGEGIDFGSGVAQEVEEQMLAVKEEFDFGQGSGNVVIGEELFAIEKSLLAILVEASEEQIVFDPHAAEDASLGTTAVVIGFVSDRREDLAHFEPAFGAADDASASRIASAVTRPETRDLPHHAKTNPVLA